MNFWTVIEEAARRGILWGVGSGLLSGIALYQKDHNLEDAVLAFVVAFISYLMFRTGVEGVSDARRAASGKVIDSDVGHGTVTSTTTVPVNTPVIVTPPAGTGNGDIPLVG